MKRKEDFKSYNILGCRIAKYFTCDSLEYADELLKNGYEFYCKCFDAQSDRKGSLWYELKNKLADSGITNYKLVFGKQYYNAWNYAVFIKKSII